MPLFKRSNDVKLFECFAEELTNDIIDTTVNIFKVDVQKTDYNIYGESLSKHYFPGVTVAGVINRDPPESDYRTLIGPDYRQSINFAFLRYTLKNISLYLEIGDTIEFNNRYYTVFHVRDDQLIGGQDDDGHNFSVVCETALQRIPPTKLEKVKRVYNERKSIYNI